MALNPLYTSETLPTTSLAALREFNDRYLAALMATPPSGWQTLIGEVIGTNAPLLTFPISQLGVKFLRSDGEERFRTLLEKSFDLKAEEFDAGYEAKWYDISKNTYAFRRWNEAAGTLVVEEQNFTAEKFAALLEAGASTAWLDTAVNFFSTTLPANLFDASKGTFSNYSSGGSSVLSIANIATEVAAMKLVKDDNGRRMNVRADTIIVPIEVEEQLNILLAKEMLAIAASTATSNTSENNPYKGRFNVIGARELTDVNDWYLVDSKLAKQLLPCVALKEQVDSSLALRQWDQSSDFFKATGKIKNAAHIWYGFGLGFPHAIRKVVGA